MKKILLASRDIILILGLTIVSMIIGGIWLKQWEINQWMLPLHYLVAPMIELLVFIPSFKWLTKHVFHDGFKTIPMRPKFKARYFGYAIGLVALCYAGTLLLGVHFVTPKINQSLLWQNVASMLGAIFIAPFVEEIVFRGVIFTQTAKQYGTKIGIAVASILFGAVHLMNGALDLMSACQLLVAGTLMGCLLNVIYLKEQNIWANFTVHAMYNGIGSLLPISLHVTPDWFGELIIKPYHQLITGGQYGIDCSLVNVVAYLVMIVMILKLKKRANV